MAAALVILGHTHRVRGTSELQADGDTLGHAENVWTTSGHLMTVIVGLTLW